MKLHICVKRKEKEHLCPSHLKRALAQFVHPVGTVVSECGEHHGPVLSLHAERPHVLLQTQTSFKRLFDF